MRISIFGLGYVGTVSAGCLASDGHDVIGVDTIPTKVDLINRGQSPIVEADIAEIIAATVQAGRLRATGDSIQAIRDTDLSFVCVGTPSQTNGNLDLRYIRRICEHIGEAIRNKEAAPHRRHPQHHLARHDAQNRDSHPGAVLREKGWDRFRGLQQS